MAKVILSKQTPNEKLRTPVAENKVNNENYIKKLDPSEYCW